MPRVLRARHPSDSAEERLLRKLARSKRASAEQVLRARTIVMSWDGADTATIAAGLGCHPQTVRHRVAQFNAEGVESVMAKSHSGRRPRLTEAQRQELVAMAVRLDGGQPPNVDPELAARNGNGMTAPNRLSKVSLDALVAAAQGRGIEIGRSQLRRVLLAAGLRWHPIYSWGSRAASSRRHAKTGPTDQE
jgi:transposase